MKEKLALHSAAELRQKAREWLARSAVNRIREDPDSGIRETDRAVTFQQNRVRYLHHGSLSIIQFVVLTSAEARASRGMLPIADLDLARNRQLRCHRWTRW
jgi:hypothetical protein